jgi:hypothetical protein
LKRAPSKDGALFSLGKPARSSVVGGMLGQSKILKLRSHALILACGIAYSLKAFNALQAIAVPLM